MSISVCLCVCLSVFPVFFSRRLIRWYTGFWQWFWQPTYPTRCSELGWAVPHSDFLAWLSSATLKKFISVSFFPILFNPFLSSAYVVSPGPRSRNSQKNYPAAYLSHFNDIRKIILLLICHISMTLEKLSCCLFVTFHWHYNSFRIQFFSFCIQSWCFIG